MIVPRAWPRKRLLKTIAAAALAIGALIALRFLPTSEFLERFQSWLESLGWWAPAAFFVVYILLALIFFPTVLLALAAGAVFGLLKGVAVVSISSTSTAAIAFLIARYAIRDRVRRRIERSPKLSAIDRAIGREGWKFVALLRLSPAAPFTVQNYLYGISAIDFWTCIGVSWATMLPATFLYVYLGTLGRDALRTSGESPTALEWAARGVGLAATIAVTVYTARIARRAMREAERTDSPFDPKVDPQTGGLPPSESPEDG